MPLATRRHTDITPQRIVDTSKRTADTSTRVAVISHSMPDRVRRCRASIVSFNVSFDLEMVRLHSKQAIFLNTLVRGERFVVSDAGNLDGADRSGGDPMRGDIVEHLTGGARNGTSSKHAARLFKVPKS